MQAVQLLVLVGVAVAVAVGADWGAIGHHFFNAEIATELFPEVLTSALVNTAKYTALGFTFGLVLGVVVALMRLSSVTPYRWLANIYIETFRGLPALLVLFFIAYGVPFASGHAFPGGTLGAVTVGLGTVGAAYMAETIRAGIQAVPSGQMEAARSLGMSKPQAMSSVILPQAFRIVTPPLTNELILLTKDSSLVYLVGVSADTRELAKFGRDGLDTYVNPTPLVVAGLCYLIITLPLSLLVRRLETATSRGRP